MAKKSRTYTVCDGDLVLKLREAGKGWYAVSSPLDPHLHTQARTIDEAFKMARDARAALQAARAKLHHRIESLAAA